MTKQTQNSKTKKNTIKRIPKLANKKKSFLLDRYFNIIKKPMVAMSFVLLLTFLIINIFISQAVSPLYFSVLNENKDAVVIYLKKIMPLPIFQTELEKYKVIYGDKIETQVFAEKYQHQQQIVALETLLQKNPQARDVLFALYQLYLSDGQTNKAQEYLKKAQLIDPTIREIQNSKL